MIVKSDLNLLFRAQRRRRIHPKMMDLKFPRVNDGHPQQVIHPSPIDHNYFFGLKIEKIILFNNIYNVHVTY